MSPSFIVVVHDPGENAQSDPSDHERCTANGVARGQLQRHEQHQQGRQQRHEHTGRPTGEAPHVDAFDAAGGRHLDLEGTGEVDRLRRLPELEPGQVHHVALARGTGPGIAAAGLWSKLCRHAPKVGHGS